MFDLYGVDLLKLGKSLSEFIHCNTSSMVGGSFFKEEFMEFSSNCSFNRNVVLVDSLIMSTFRTCGFQSVSSHCAQCLQTRHKIHQLVFFLV
jgi:hypothetical protein